MLVESSGLCEAKSRQTNRQTNKQSRRIDWLLHEIVMQRSASQRTVARVKGLTSQHEQEGDINKKRSTREASYQASAWPRQLSSRMAANKRKTARQFIGKLVILCLALGLSLAASRAATLQAEPDGQAPRITIQPQDLVAAEGESSELNCDAEGSPEPQIEWYHDGELIRSATQTRTVMGGSIQFLDLRPPEGRLRPSEAGTYHCVARNQFGEARSRNASLQVAYIRAQFRLFPRDKLAALGDTVTMSCLPSAWPAPRLVWRRDGRLLEASEQEPGGKPATTEVEPKYSVNRIAQASGGEELGADYFGSQLVIRRVEKSDEGQYSCLAETRASHRILERESPSGKLQVAVKPYLLEPAEHKVVEVGGKVALACRMAGDPAPVVSWRKHNGQPLSQKAQIDPIDKTLTIEQLTIADQGTYVCEGENLVGSAKSLATITVKSRPKFIVQPENQEVDVGASVQLRCAGEASPHPMLFWYKEGHRQLMFAPNIQGQSQTAKPNSPWPQAAALVAPNSDTSPAINKLFSMPLTGDQLYSPQTNSFSNNYFGNRIYVDSQGTLNIINATTSDNGYYACALISSVGSVMAKAKLTIRQSPNNPLGAQDFSVQTNPADSKLGANSYLNYNSKFDLLPPPVIKFGATNQTLPTNTNVKLGCEVVSQVSYKIQWFFNNQILKEEIPRVMILEDGALSLNNLRISDSGVYTCVVTAAEDQLMPVAAPFEPIDSSMLTSAPPIQQSTSHSAILKVASPMNPNIQFYRMDPFQFPSSPGPAYLVSTNGKDAITIAWDPPAESGTLPIKEYVVEHYDTSKEHLGWRVIYRVKGKESLLIDGLSEDGSHFFIIRAGNSHGVGPSSAIAGPMRTVSGEAHYQEEAQRRKFSSDAKRSGLDSGYSSSGRSDANQARERLMTITTNLWGLTPINSNSMRLQWSIRLADNLTDSRQLGDTASVSDFLEGYSIRYRALGLGESLLNKEPLAGNNWNGWSSPDYNHPMSLPLVTSFLDQDTENQGELDRRRREAFNQYDYSHEFNEVKVVDHSTEHYTVNNLLPFTLYQFFVVPYYKEIDGVPSNILSAQTNEDRPSIAPPYLTVRPINNTAIRLLWVHVPPIYSNGILRGYIARINKSDISDESSSSESPNIINLPWSSLKAVSLNSNLNSISQQKNGQQSQLTMNSDGQQYIVMYDFTNLTYKSFYSIQVAASTSVGPGPWSEPQNFIMDPKVLSEVSKSFGPNDFDDVLSKSFIPSNLQNFRNFVSQSDGQHQGIYLYSGLGLITLLLIVIAGYVIYRRNNQRMFNWKKALSEHFNNKFYMPTPMTEQDHPASLHQQNIYDHQHHLIYAARPQITTSVQQATAIKPQHPALWANGGVCMNGIVGSLPRHGALGIPSGASDASNLARRLANGDEQSALLMNTKDYIDHRLHNTTITGAQLMGSDHHHLQQQQQQQILQQRSNFGISRTLNLNGQGHPHGQLHHNQLQQPLVNHQSGNDYYSVINNMSEYEELDQQQRGQFQMMGGNNGSERHQTTSSNSDTSCPSSVTRLLPNQNYTRDFLKKNFNEQQHEMVLQQVGINDGKQPFATMMNGEHSRFNNATMASLTPYATTNLMNAVNQQQAAGQMVIPVQMNNELQYRQQKLLLHGNKSFDDSSKPLLNQQQQQCNPYDQQQVNIVQNPMTVFRTLQRNPMSGQQFQQSRGQQQQAEKLMVDGMRTNVYEHIDYGVDASNGQQQQSQMSSSNHSQQQSSGSNSQAYSLSGSQVSHEMISSSTSSGSVKSGSQQQQPVDQQVMKALNSSQVQAKFRRGSNLN